METPTLADYMKRYFVYGTDLVSSLSDGMLDFFKLNTDEPYGAPQPDPSPDYEAGAP